MLGMATCPQSRMSYRPSWRRAPVLSCWPHSPNRGQLHGGIGVHSLALVAKRHSTRRALVLKLLIDTNIFIPLEPATAPGIEDTSPNAAQLHRLSQEGGHTTYLHPAQHFDINRDRDSARAQVRRVLSSKYPHLPEPPNVLSRHTTVLGSPDHGTNDWVDNQLIVAVEADAVDFLVSEDKGVRAKSRRLGIGNRVLSLDEAVRLLGGKPSVAAPPAVRSIPPHALAKDDPIFTSFREDYPGFDKWFADCCRQHRQTWKIDGGVSLAALCIVKSETASGNSPFGDKPLKICSFKVSEQFNGFKYGELLLKTVFDYASAHHHTGIYVTVFEKHAPLIELLDDFGFRRTVDRTGLGELVLAKNLTPRPGLDGLDYHIAYGPPAFDTSRPWHVVPIRPQYSDALFPETCQARSLFDGHLSFGNAIRKAYLCHAPTRQIQRGDVLAFFRTQDRQGMLAVGIVEDTFVSRDPGQITRLVARRTVYSAKEIDGMCDKRDVLAILFRQAMLARPPIPPIDLKDSGVFRREPQSIMKVSKEGTQWLVKRLGV